MQHEMIVIYHDNIKVVKILDLSINQGIKVELKNIQQSLISLSGKFKNSFIAWSHIDLEKELNFDQWSKIISHPLKIVSFETSHNYYIDSSIGFVEQTPFIKVNKNVEYPTWLMSSDVGIAHASILIKYQNLLKHQLSFDLFLNTIAKVGMSEGLLCYSNPFLLKNSNIKINKNSASKVEMIQFIKSNYKLRWIFLYAFNQLIYKTKFFGVSLFLSLFKKKIKIKITFKDIVIINSNTSISPTIDVLIPTLGRENYLKDVLLDLSKQTLLPKKVIIIEQIPTEGAKSKLDFLTEDWPFQIDHTLIHQLGACNARNIGLSKVTSDWIFFSDDDIRFNNTFLEDGFKYLSLYQTDAISLSCLQTNEIENHRKVFQSATFGSGTSIVKYKALKDAKFGMEYEFGYGEDADFGMQLRNTGTDIFYVPFVKMLHLKALIGGFRSKIYREWDKDLVQPKPSPTVMVYKLKHATKEQLESYKTTLFLKFYRSQPIRNPFRYFKQMNKAWNKSLYWANYLIKKHSNEI